MAFPFTMFANDFEKGPMFFQGLQALNPNIAKDLSELLTGCGAIMPSRISSDKVSSLKSIA